MTTGTRNSWPYRKARAARLAIAKATNEPCVRCGRPINYELSGNHPAGATLDHLDLVRDTGSDLFEPDRAAPAHRWCNSRHGGLVGHRRDGTGYRQPARVNGQRVPAADPIAAPTVLARLETGPSVAAEPPAPMIW